MANKDKRFILCAECIECSRYFNNTKNECFGESEPCFEWQPKSKQEYDKDNTKRR